MRVDPEGRCAAMLLYGAHLAILPFKHADMVLEEHEPDTPLIARQDKKTQYTALSNRRVFTLYDACISYDMPLEKERFALAIYYAVLHDVHVCTCVCGFICTCMTCSPQAVCI